MTNIEFTPSGQPRCVRAQRRQFARAAAALRQPDGAAGLPIVKKMDAEAAALIALLRLGARELQLQNQPAPAVTKNRTRAAGSIRLGTCQRLDIAEGCQPIFRSMAGCSSSAGEAATRGQAPAPSVSIRRLPARGAE